jgi:hypothetical protein
VSYIRYLALILLNTKYRSDSSVQDSINVLLRYSLLQRLYDTRIYYIHPMIQLWIQQHLPSEDRRKNTRKALDILHRTYTWRHDAGSRKFSNRIAPYLKQVLYNVKLYRTDVGALSIKSSPLLTQIYLSEHWFTQTTAYLSSMAILIHSKIEDMLL